MSNSRSKKTKVAPIGTDSTNTKVQKPSKPNPQLKAITLIQQNIEDVRAARKITSSEYTELKQDADKLQALYDARKYRTDEFKTIIAQLNLKLEEIKLRQRIQEIAAEVLPKTADLEHLKDATRALEDNTSVFAKKTPPKQTTGWFSCFSCCTKAPEDAEEKKPLLSPIN